MTITTHFRFVGYLLSRFYTSITSCPLMIGVVAAFAVGCSSAAADKQGPSVSTDIGVALTDNYDNQSNYGLVALDTTHTNIVSFMLNAGVVSSLATHQHLSSKLRFGVDITRNHDLYVVSNTEQCSGFSGIQVGSSSEKLTALTIDHIAHLSPDAIPMSGVARFRAGDSKFVLVLKRVCSRVDLKLDKVLIHSIKVEGVASSSHLFANSTTPLINSPAEFNRTFTSPLSENLKAAIYLFEQSTEGLSFTIDCSAADGKARQTVVVHIPYDKIIRNNIYQLSLSANNLTPEPEVTIVAKFCLLPWNSEDIDSGYPDLNTSVEIDAEKFAFDSKNVAFDAAKHTIHVSFRGDTLRIPFTGKFDKGLTVNSVDSRVEMVPVANSRYAYDTIELRLAQPKGGSGYSFILNIKNALSINSLGSDYTITVDQNSPASVVIGGMEWMAFNCGSGREFPILDMGQSVRAIYKASWGDYVNMCQWGKRPKALPNSFIPPSLSMRYVEPTYSDGGIQTSDSWVEKTPCPDGWRLPKLAEVRKFFPPSGTAIIGGNVVKYVVDGVNYTAQVVATGGQNYITQNAVSPGSDKIMSYVPKILVISDGKGEIIFPLSGYRRQDSVQNGDVDYCDIAYKIGTAFFIWCDYQNGGRSDCAQAAGINRYGAISVDSFDFGNQLKGTWNTVRCVRNI